MYVKYVFIKLRLLVRGFLIHVLLLLLCSYMINLSQHLNTRTTIRSNISTNVRRQK